MSKKMKPPPPRFPTCDKDNICDRWRRDYIKYLEAEKELCLADAKQLGYYNTGIESELRVLTRIIGHLRLPDE